MRYGKLTRIYVYETLCPQQMLSGGVRWVGVGLVGFRVDVIMKIRGGGVWLGGGVRVDVTQN